MTKSKPNHKFPDFPAERPRPTMMHHRPRYDHYERDDGSVVIHDTENGNAWVKADAGSAVELSEKA